MFAQAAGGVRQGGVQLHPINQVKQRGLVGADAGKDLRERLEVGEPACHILFPGIVARRGRPLFAHQVVEIVARHGAVEIGDENT